MTSKFQHNSMRLEDKTFFLGDVLHCPTRYRSHLYKERENIYLYTNNIANILIEYGFSVANIGEIFWNSKAFMKNYLKGCTLFR